jgi:predicted amidophosphoribosyltransferase
MIVLFPSILPMFFFIRRLSRSVRHHDRKRRNLCVHCGYDLRASKDRCPECGEPIPTSAPNAILLPPATGT